MMQETIDLKNKKIICSKCYNELKPNAYDKNIFTCVNCNANVFLNVEDDKEKFLVINKKIPSKNKVQNKNEIQNNAEDNTKDNVVTEVETQSNQSRKEEHKKQFAGILKEIIFDIILISFIIACPIIATIYLFNVFQYETTLIAAIIISIAIWLFFLWAIILYLKASIKREWQWCQTAEN